MVRTDAAECPWRRQVPSNMLLWWHPPAGRAAYSCTHLSLLPADDADASNWQDEWGAANTLLVPWVDMLNHSGDAGELPRDSGIENGIETCVQQQTAPGTIGIPQKLPSVFRAKTALCG
jgi:hypothetical protein